MVSGAVIIGKPIGPGMVGPFTRREFNDFKDKGQLELYARTPIEVAYPCCLESSTLVSYHEGILVNIFFGDEGLDIESFKERVSGGLVAATKRVKEKQDDCIMRGFPSPWESDFDWTKVCREDVFGKEVVLKPYMEVVEIYSNRDAGMKYFEIVNDLSGKTYRARIERHGLFEKLKFERDIDEALELRRKVSERP